MPKCAVPNKQQKYVCNSKLQICECMCARTIWWGLVLLHMCKYVYNRASTRASDAVQQHNACDIQCKNRGSYDLKYAEFSIHVQHMEICALCVHHIVVCTECACSILASIGRGRVDWTLPEANYIQPNTQIIPPRTPPPISASGHLILWWAPNVIFNPTLRLSPNQC